MQHKLILTMQVMPYILTRGLQVTESWCGFLFLNMVTKLSEILNSVQLVCRKICEQTAFSNKTNQSTVYKNLQIYTSNVKSCIKFDKSLCGNHFQRVVDWLTVSTQYPVMQFLAETKSMKLIHAELFFKQN